MKPKNRHSATGLLRQGIRMILPQTQQLNVLALLRQKKPTM
nr:MAG TPA: hypothetical protein [Caudoviricetes sp.]